ncbi:MAG: histidine ammonia-lyase, partial [Acidobacteria bacterium]
MTPTPQLEPVSLDGEHLSLDDLEAVAHRGAPVEVRPAAREGVTWARRVVDEAVKRGAVVYGVTTGFGNFADVHIPPDRLRDLQLNLVRSHAAGV